MARRSLRDRNASAIAADPVAAPQPAAPAQKALAAVPDVDVPQKAAQKPQKAPERPASTPEAREPKQSAKKAPAAPAATRPTAGEGRLVLWTPEAIRARMQTEQRTTGKRYLDQVLDAIEATHEQLPDLIAASGEKAHVQGSIFERVIETEHHDRRVQLTIRGVLDSQLAVIDQLVASSGAASRSALVNAALDANLPS
jgi:hypothetical protein